MFRKDRLFASLALPALFLAVPSVMLAQFENGSINGTLHDPSGAPVANAAVTITNNATGIATSAKTNDAGEYSAPSLRVGVYTVKATAPGFSDAVAQNITISVDGRQHIDLTFSVGAAAATSVQVSDVALQLETETSQRSQTISNYQSAALPLVSRNYSDLLGLVAGARQAPTAATTTSISSTVRAGSYNVNGQRSVLNNFLLDGMDNNAYGESNQGFDNQIIAIPPDSVAQFDVITNNESAEYGRSSGATINVASASGGNKFHGLAYDFLRNTDLNAEGFFKPETLSSTGVIPFKKSTFNRNQFGGNISGPVLRDRMFFFLDYEGFRQVLKPLSVLTLPTQNELNGKLVVAVKDPLTGTVTPANTAIPAAEIDPLSAQIVGYFRQLDNLLPASGATATGLAVNDYPVEAPFDDNSDKGDLRLDYQQNQNNSWFLRVSDRKENAVNDPTIPLPLDGQSNGKIRILDQQVALGYTHLFGANKVLDARFGISRTKAGKYTLSIGDNVFSIPGLPSNPVVAGGLPSIAITGFTAFGRQSTNPQWQNPALLDPKANYTWVLGNHSLRFGGEYEHVWMAVNDNNPLYGSYTYSGAYSNDGGSSVSDNYWADFLFGTTSSYSLANYFVAHLRQTLVNGYAQDDWKVSPKLTLNLGMRWEYGSPYSEENNYISNFDPATQTVLTVTPGASGTGITPYTGGGVYGHTLVHPDLNDFAPRLGFAYQLMPKVVLRGGYGTSYVHYTRAGSGDILAINAPQAQFTSVTQSKPTTTNHCATGATSTSCYVTAGQGFPTGIATTFNPTTDNITWVPANTRDSYVESYFLDLQQQLAKNILFDVSYIGNHGVKLQGMLNGNQRNPLAGNARQFPKWPSDITEALNEFWSHYDALQVRYQQQMTGGLTVLDSFTWENSRDVVSASLEGNTPSPQNGENIAADYGQSDYNLPVANVLSLVYEVPVGNGRRYMHHANPIVDGILGGWQVSAINTDQAGTPFNLTYTPNVATQVSPQISATYRGANEYRPNRLTGVPLLEHQKLATTGYIQYVNYKALTLPAEETTAGQLLSPFGDLARNPARTPEFNELDLDFNKQFNLGFHDAKLEFRSELYNILNHTNLYLPSSALSGTLGAAPTGGGTISSTYEPRIVQFALKAIF